MQRRWSLKDVMDAHEVLDVLEEARLRAEMEAENKSKVSAGHRGRRW